MEIPYARWYPQISKRHSRRRYDISRPIPDAVLDTLRRVCAEFRPFRGARVELITASPEKIFKGMLGSYGKVKGASAYFAFIGNLQNPHVQEIAGYTGEGLILEASALGLGTCWVAGTFRPEAVAKAIEIEDKEKVLAVSPIGFAGEFKTLEERLVSGFVKSNQRRPLADLVSGEEETRWPSWLKIALEAARLAPSAINRQPWRFFIERTAVTISLDSGIKDAAISKRLDCGIAMLHLEVAALSQNIHGKWELLEAPKVAKFSF